MAQKAADLLGREPTACNLVHLQGAVKVPPGDMLLVDIPREDASILVAALKELGIHETGSISIEPIEVQLSAAADAAERRAPGAPADAVVWEEVEARTQEQSRLTISYVVFIVLAGLIAAAGIYLDSSIVVVGAMVVGPEFGPIAAFCVAFVERRMRLATEALVALAVGFPASIAAVLLTSVIFRATGVTPDTFSERDHALSTSISNPDFFAFFIAFCAGMAGILSLSTSKSGALIGVLISVTTIPAAANVGVSAAYGDHDAMLGSIVQLAINIGGILLAGIVTLSVQRFFYRRRRADHRTPLDRPALGFRSARTPTAAPGPERKPEDDRLDPQALP